MKSRLNSESSGITIMWDVAMIRIRIIKCKEDSKISFDSIVRLLWLG